MPSPHDARRAQLKQLARLHGVQTSYISADDKRVTPPLDSVESALRALGADMDRPAQAIRDRVRWLRRVLQPVVAAWNGRGSAELRLGGRPPAKVTATIVLESGETFEQTHRVAELKQREANGPDGEPETITRLPLGQRLPAGYHTLTLTYGKHEHRATVISAPKLSYRHPTDEADKEWGLFCPLYALHSERSHGMGDLTDLKALATWQASLGARVVGSLPLLAVYVDEPFDPSPYSPVSRLFFSEMWVDPAQTPEFAEAPEVREKMASGGFQRERDSLRSTALVQYRRQAALRRSLLDPLAQRFFDAGADRGPEYKRFVESTPYLEEYARFRAVMERQCVGWSDWSDRLRRGAFRSNDFNPAHERYHLYAQFQFDRQLNALKHDINGDDALLYLDLPVGVRRDGFDVWKWLELFATDASVGAPPDPYFAAGQDWAFPPVRPDASRETGHRWLVDCLRSHMRYADYLRLDHVMAFHRLFWLPPGAGAAEGLYVTYPQDEMFAILCLESHRNRCQLIGENLGTVPPAVNKALETHHISPLYVAEYEISPKPDAALAPVPPTAVASLNTHDMPPIARFWTGDDIDDRVSLGGLGAKLAAKDRTHRTRCANAVTTFLTARGLLRDDALSSLRDALLEHLADSEADIVLINIEDMWLETHWQNVPGTTDEYPNWRHKLRYALEQIVDDDELADRLRRIDRARKAHATQRAD